MFFASSFVFADDGWVTVPRQEQIVHQLEEEDHSIWVVFAKTFGSERVRVRFPETPFYHNFENQFEAHATHDGHGEMSLTVHKKNKADSSLQMPGYEITYRDTETNGWVFEKHIETEEFHYVLRMYHSLQNRLIFQQFTDSFEIERI